MPNPWLLAQLQAQYPQAPPPLHQQDLTDQQYQALANRADRVRYPGEDQFLSAGTPDQRLGTLFGAMQRARTPQEAEALKYQLAIDPSQAYPSQPGIRASSPSERLRGHEADLWQGLENGVMQAPLVGPAARYLGGFDPAGNVSRLTHVQTDPSYGDVVPFKGKGATLIQFERNPRTLKEVGDVYKVFKRGLGDPENPREFMRYPAADLKFPFLDDPLFEKVTDVLHRKAPSMKFDAGRVGAALAMDLKGPVTPDEFRITLKQAFDMVGGGDPVHADGSSAFNDLANQILGELGHRQRGLRDVGTPTSIMPFQKRD